MNTAHGQVIGMNAAIGQRKGCDAANSQGTRTNTPHGEVIGVNAAVSQRKGCNAANHKRI